MGLMSLVLDLHAALYLYLSFCRTPELFGPELIRFVIQGSQGGECDQANRHRQCIRYVI